MFRRIAKAGILLFLSLGCLRRVSATEDNLSGDRIYVDTKNSYFSLIPPKGWEKEDYPDTRTKVAWREPSDQRVLLRVIAREATESYDELKVSQMDNAQKFASRGVNLHFSETSLQNIPVILLEGDIPGTGRTRLLFFLLDGIYFNCQYAAPNRQLYDKHLKCTMDALSTISSIADRHRDPEKKKEQQLSWFRRYSFLLKQLNENEAAKALAREGLKKFPGDAELEKIIKP